MVENNGRQSRSPAESRTQMIEIAFPNDANPLGTVFGGRVLQLIDICGTISAQKHARSIVVTASIDYVHFRQPIFVGEWIILKAWVNFVGRTSMEVQVEVYAENSITGEQRHCCTAFLTYVALDKQRNPRPVPFLEIKTEEEARRFEEGKRRRAWRLKHPDTYGEEQ